MSSDELRITPSESKLDARQVDDLFAGIASCPQLNGNGSRRCTIDLSKQTFISPAGLTGVILAAKALRTRGWHPVVIFPETESVANYLCWMKLPDALQGVAQCCDAFGPSSSGESNAILEITPVDRGTDVTALRGLVADRVEAMLRGQLGYGSGECRSFAAVMLELTQNIIDHSESGGYIAAQTYNTHTGRFVYISVADDGIGLRASLMDRYPGAHRWNDMELILNALRPEFSRHHGRGLGLALVKKVCFDRDGTLQIRTGTTRLYLRNGRSRSVTGAPFAGTQVALSFTQ